MRKISKKEKEKRKLIAFRVMIALLCIAVALVFIRSYYIKNKQNDLDIKSRYTFSVDIDAYGDEITGQYQTTTLSYDDSFFSDLPNSVCIFLIMSFTSWSMRLKLL